jgi:hypothetical protein
MKVVERAPEPTTPPELGALALNRLFGRQAAGDVCGFVSGVASKSFLQ